MAETITAAALGDLLGISERRVKQLRADGVLPGAPGAPYEMRECVRAYCAHLRPASGRAAAGGAAEPTLNEQRISLIHEQTRKLRMENDHQSSLFLQAADVREAVSGATLVLRTTLLALPSGHAAEIARLRNPNLVFARLRDLIWDALTELSETLGAKGMADRGNPPPVKPTYVAGEDAA
jgi:phage terminase Nu1 subunit (DNA packaging protein)